MTVVRLTEENLLLYSPVFDGDALFEELDALGSPSLILAPNHYHHLALPRYLKRYPHAVPVASPGAIPRLKKQGHPYIRDFHELLSKLPPDVELVENPESKTGEVWVSVQESSGERTWIVCDAFFNVTQPMGGAFGKVLNLLQIQPGLRISRLFRALGVKNVKTYREWLLARIETDQPRRVVVGHGDILDGADVPHHLKQAVLQRWPG